jgi:hypothetical protein
MRQWIEDYKNGGTLYQEEEQQETKEPEVRYIF